ncbi:hypothetical protein OPU71_18510 [Niveibacterium sp. 24ML]|uniref:hypothetical protein n=1 Tax=Niveibacterium sp. 24ML TaxID=2985512 RepID=UPI00226F2CB0|nr:hypothetical protein [Niveibacterium sp. 24ML]MCX9158119.1 hypothetical protein [Niveibacterium sp. 24ML]
MSKFSIRRARLGAFKSRFRLPGALRRPRSRQEGIMILRWLATRSEEVAKYGSVIAGIASLQSYWGLIGTCAVYVMCHGLALHFTLRARRLEELPVIVLGAHHDERGARSKGSP